MAETYRGRLMHVQPVLADEVYAFFQNCYHLKDWLLNDPASASAAADVEKFISRTPSLALCADLANGSKHLTLTRSRRHAEGTPSLATTRFKGRVEPGGIMVSAQFEVSAGDQTLDAYALAVDCWEAWNAYLEAKGLITVRVVPPYVPPRG
ncbi:MAG: hypothetical protein WD249_01720 [Gaiellaceae bacterium]